MEDFTWKYEEKVWDAVTKRFKLLPVDISGIQAIYVNPKWKQSKVGDFLTFDKKKKQKGKKSKK